MLLLDCGWSICEQLALSQGNFLAEGATVEEGAEVESGVEGSEQGQGEMVKCD